MLAYKYRFHGHGSLRYLFRNGTTARNRQVLVRYCENRNRTDSRVAVVVGKKVSKSAVKRNRIRRRVFEVVRTHLDVLKPSHDVSLTVFSLELLTMPPKELEGVVLGALAQAGLLSRSEAKSDKIEGSL